MNTQQSSHAKATSSYLVVAANSISEAARCAFIGGTIGVVGGAFLGAVIDGVTFAATGSESIQLMQVVLSILGTAGTGAAIGGSALASVGAAAGSVISTNKKKAAKKKAIESSRSIYRIAIAKDMKESGTGFSDSDKSFTRHPHREPIIIRLAEHQTIN